MSSLSLIKNSQLWIAALLVIAFFTACSTSFQDRQIQNLSGVWQVEEVESTIGVFSGGKFDPIEPPVRKTGNLGFFEFSKFNVEYSFLRDDSLFVGSGLYSTESKKRGTKILFSDKENILLLPPDNNRHNIIFNPTANGIIMLLSFIPECRCLAETYTITLRKIQESKTHL